MRAWAHARYDSQGHTMSKISQLAQSIKTTSKNEAEHIEQGLRSDFEKTRQNISGYLVSVADTIKSDIRSQLSQSAAMAVAESEAATSQAAEQIKQQIDQLQQRINSQISEQEAQILQQLISQLQQSFDQIEAQADKMSDAATWFKIKLDQSIEQYERQLASAKKMLDTTQQEAEAQQWNIDSMTTMIKESQDKHQKMFESVTQKFRTTDAEAGQLMQQVTYHTRTASEQMQKRIDQTQQHMTAQLAQIDKTADNLEDSITRKLFQRTYHPLAMIAWITLLLLVTAFTSCSVYTNHKTASQLDTQVQQKQAILADLNKPIQAAQAAQLGNLVTIEQTQDGILIKSRHPQTTKTINKGGLTSSQDQKALLIQTR